MEQAVNLFCYILGKTAVNDGFYSSLSLDFHFFLDLYVNGIGSSVDNNRWYRIRTSYWVENLQLPFCLSIKSTHEFKWYAETLWTLCRDFMDFMQRLCG